MGHSPFLKVLFVTVGMPLKVEKAGFWGEDGGEERCGEKSIERIDRGCFGTIHGLRVPMDLNERKIGGKIVDYGHKW